MFRNKDVKKLSWFYIWALVMACCMAFANLTGWRVLTFNSQQTWNATGPAGYHK